MAIHKGAKKAYAALLKRDDGLGRASSKRRKGSLNVPNRFLGQRPARVQWQSLADLYTAYESIYLGGAGFRREYQSQCGLSFVAFDRNFFHLVQLRRNGVADDVRLNIQEEKPVIRSTADGLGDYRLADPRRAPHLAAGLDTLLMPHAVFTIPKPQTAHLAFFKHYGNKPDPCMVAMLGRSESDGCLIPVTCFPVRLRRAKTYYEEWGDGLLWRRGDPPLAPLKDQQPPFGG